MSQATWTWRLEAACRGMDTSLWYPTRGESVRNAKEVCVGCPVKDACLDAAMGEPEYFGIWGGLGDKERRALRRTAAAA